MSLSEWWNDCVGCQCVFLSSVLKKQTVLLCAHHSTGIALGKKYWNKCILFLCLSLRWINGLIKASPHYFHRFHLSLLQSFSPSVLLPRPCANSDLPPPLGSRLKQPFNLQNPGIRLRAGVQTSRGCSGGQIRFLYSCHWGPFCFQWERLTESQLGLQ